MSGSYANEIGSRNYNYGGFSVVKQLYILEIALYCLEEMPWTFWGSRQMCEIAHITIACIVSNLHKKRTWNSLEARMA